jgi:hypothetical protein
MYLIIGNEHESCAAGVRAALQRLGHTVVVNPDPFGVTGRLRWRFDTYRSTNEYGVAPATGDLGTTLEGVFVRHYGGLQDIDGWSVDDLSYMRSEGMAALLAWLHELDCTVVGRLGDDGWYRPRRPLPEWVGVLATCGLPTPRVVVTNVADAGRHEREWSGRATYRPLTSPRSYAIGGAGWSELAKVMHHIPVCLTEPIDAPPGAVTFACGRTFWSKPDLPGRDPLDDGVRRVADRLESDFIQLSYTTGPAGPTFTGVSVAPLCELHSGGDQLAIAACIAEALTAGAASRVVHA